MCENLTYMHWIYSTKHVSLEGFRSTRASKYQIFFRILNFQISHIFGGFRILMLM